MSSLVGATMMASGSCSSLKELAATPSAISCCRIGSRNAAWGEKKCIYTLSTSKFTGQLLILISPFYQILFGHRPWDLCQQRWSGCHASAQGSASHNQTCWQCFSETGTILPHQRSEGKRLTLLTQQTIPHLQFKHTPTSKDSSYLYHKFCFTPHLWYICKSISSVYSS